MVEGEIPGTFDVSTKVTLNENIHILHIDTVRVNSVQPAQRLTTAEKHFRTLDQVWEALGLILHAGCSISVRNWSWECHPHRGSVRTSQVCYPTRMINKWLSDQKQEHKVNTIASETVSEPRLSVRVLAFHLELPISRSPFRMILPFVSHTEFDSEPKISTTAIWHINVSTTNLSRSKAEDNNLEFWRIKEELWRTSNLWIAERHYWMIPDRGQIACTRYHAHRTGHSSQWTSDFALDWTSICVSILMCVIPNKPFLSMRSRLQILLNPLCSL